MTLTSIATNGRILITDGLQAASGKGKFRTDNRNGCGKYEDSVDDKWFSGFAEKENDVYRKQCKILIESIAESKDKNKGTKTDKRVVDVEREEERDPELEIVVRKRWTKEVNKLVIRCFCQSNPT